MEWLLIIVGLFLFVASVIDWKLKMLPSIFLTAILFMVAFLNPANLWFGLLTFIMAYLLYEAHFFSGVADLKIMTTLGFLISTTNWFFAFIILTMVYGIIWIAVVKLRLKKEQNVAFVPVFLFVFATILILGGFH